MWRALGTNSVKNKKARIIVYCLLAFYVLIVMVVFFGAEKFGRLTAYYDLKMGHYEIRTYGLHLPLVFISQAKNLEEHGIAYQRIAGCLVDGFVVKFASGYNGVMKKAIKRDMGIDVDKLL